MSGVEGFVVELTVVGGRRGGGEVRPENPVRCASVANPGVVAN
jgi:hypothetical protein